MKILSNKRELQDYVKVCPYCKCKFTFNELDERKDKTNSYVNCPECTKRIYINQVWDKCIVRGWSF